MLYTSRSLESTGNVKKFTCHDFLKNLFCHNQNVLFFAFSFVSCKKYFWENVLNSCVLKILSINTYAGECCSTSSGGRCVKIFYSSDEFLQLLKKKISLSIKFNILQSNNN